MAAILEAKYEKPDLEAIADNQIHLPEGDRKQLLTVLNWHDAAFQGLIGHWNSKKIKLMLKKGAELFHRHLYKIPHAYHQLVKIEVNQLVAIGVLTPVWESRWASPLFVILKKDGTVQFVLDF